MTDRHPSLALSTALLLPTLVLAACGGGSGSAPASPFPPAASPASPGSASGTLPSGHPPMEEAGLPAGHPPVGAASVDPAQAISGTVALGPKLGVTPEAGWALYVIARAADGQIQAVRRMDGLTFPAAFQVSAADAMTAGSSFTGPFDITARLSKTGDAMPAPGDLEGTTKGVKPGAKDVRVVIDTVRK